MSNPEHVEIVGQGAQAISKFRDANPKEYFDLREADLAKSDLTKADLSGAELESAKLTRAQLTGANLAGARLRRAKLDRADLRSADLRGADLTRAYLRGARLEQANLSGADLSDANLFWVNLSQAIIGNANLSHANLGLTSLSDIDLSHARGLEAVNHRNSSPISVNTLYMSKGKIPKGFLQGCGVPDNLIDYLPSLIGSLKAIQFYSCFISYSHKDEDFCQRLHSRMRDEHLRVWFAPEDIKSGQKIHEQIETAIRLHDKLLRVISKSSMQSEWVATEIYHARQREQKEGRRILFPISLVSFDDIRNWKLFDADTGKDMAREIREYFIPDFSHWKNHNNFEEAFQRLFQRLLQDLKDKP